MLIYISGFHEAIEDDRLIRQEFNLVQKRCIQSGNEVINPACDGYRKSLKEAYVEINCEDSLIVHKAVKTCKGLNIIIGLTSILMADKVLFLQNYYISAQGTIEFDFCKYIGKEYQILT